MAPSSPVGPAPGGTTVSRAGPDAVMPCRLPISLNTGVPPNRVAGRGGLSTELSEQDRSSKLRDYRMVRRAENITGTRQRIVEATVALHGSIGPAATTVSAIAEAAGVTRLT